MKRWLFVSLATLLVIFTLIAVAVTLVRDDAAYDALRELAHWIRQ